MKYLEDIPWWTCDEGDDNYCVYSDTDSIYMHAEPYLRKYWKNFDELPTSKIDKGLEQVALKHQDYVTENYNQLANEYFNSGTHSLEMKTECVIRSAYFRAHRRYAQWITKQEGIEKEKLDVKGLEFKKSNFPPILGKFFEDIVISVLKGSQQSEIDDKVKIFRKKILDGTISITNLGNPTAVKQLNKHRGLPPRPGKIFSVLNVVYSKNLKDRKVGAPAAVRAAIRYNDLIRFWGLNKNHNYISQGDKIKWVYLKSNPYQLEALAFLEWDYPEKIRTFIEKYADRNKIFESILLNKVEGFYGDMEWQLSLNPYQKMFFNL